MQDGRNGKKWKKNSRTEWSGFVFVRHRDCLGGYTCPNNDCPFYKQFKYDNLQTSKMMEPVSIVLLWGTTHHVSPRKYTTFSNDKEATAYHCGQHNYAAKEISKRSSDIVRNAITRDCSSTPGAIQSTSIIADLRSRKNWQEVEKNAKKVGNVK